MNLLCRKKVTKLFATCMLGLSLTTPAIAATATFNFTQSGNTYGITSTASGFSSYVTAWGKVLNTKTGVYKYSSNRGYKKASATAQQSINNANYVNRTGGVYTD